MLSYFKFVFFLGLCGGALVSPRVILSAFHCADVGYKICKNGTAVLGAHEYNYWKRHKYYSVKVVDVLYPENPHRDYEPWYSNNHDFALMVLEEPAKMSPTVQPICLPQPQADYGGLDAIASGWGRFAAPDISTSQSNFLRKVTLKVSKKTYYHRHYFGTELNKNKKGEWMDPCRGDSG